MSSVPRPAMETALASPALVEAQDRSGWVALFADDGEVADPVGARPHRHANDGIGRFWDTFIAGNTIRFEVHADVERAARAQVVRDITIHTTMATGFEIAVPCHLIYTIDGERLARLAAHWELRSMSMQVLRGGWLGWKTMATVGWRMVRNQGFGGALAYSMAGVRGVFGRGRKMVHRFADSLAEGDAAGVRAALGEARVELPDGTITTAGGLAACRGSGFAVDKVIAAGRTVSFRWRDDSGHGVGQARFSGRRRTPSRLWLAAVTR